MDEDGQARLQQQTHDDGMRRRECREAVPGEAPGRWRHRRVGSRLLAPRQERAQRQQGRRNRGGDAFARRRVGQVHYRARGGEQCHEHRDAEEARVQFQQRLDRLRRAQPQLPSGARSRHTACREQQQQHEAELCRVHRCSEGQQRRTRPLGQDL
eukprot:7383235-Prymnesium_polylepis.1